MNIKITIARSSDGKYVALSSAKNEIIHTEETIASMFAYCEEHFTSELKSGAVNLDFSPLYEMDEPFPVNGKSRIYITKSQICSDHSIWIYTYGFFDRLLERTNAIIV